MKARLRPIRSATFEPIRMNAADTSASRAIAPCTPLTVVSRSSTTLEIDTFISDVSTTSTNIAAESSSASRLLPEVGSAMTTQHPLAQLGSHDHGQPCADADEPLPARELDRVEDPLQEVQLGREDDR